MHTQYKTELVGPNGMSNQGLPAEIDEIANRYGYHHWRLTAITPFGTAKNAWSFLLTFEREAPAE